MSNTNFASTKGESVQKQDFDIAIIGGGASGMAAAWSARQCLKDTGKPAKIALFERNDRLGKKLLTTGNGRCNLTNLDRCIEHFHGSDRSFAELALNRFPPELVIERFTAIGLCTVVEDDGKVFPASLNATSVLDALRCLLDESEIAIITGAAVSSLKISGNLFTLKTGDGTTYTSRAVIIATGGKCAPSTGSDGSGYKLLTGFSHDVLPVYPCIVQVTTATDFVKPLSGLKIRGNARLYIGSNFIREESGEILFTDYGLSGPPLLQLSGHISREIIKHADKQSRPSIELHLDFLPGVSFESTVAMLEARKSSFTARTLEEYLTGLFIRRLAYGILKNSLDKPLSAPVASLSKDEIVRVAQTCKKVVIPVTGTLSFAQAQTTGGGVATDAFNPSSMESFKCKGLFACGEVLDIHGDCGGFNLQWAWASGFLAAESAVTFLEGSS